MSHKFYLGTKVYYKEWLGGRGGKLVIADFSSSTENYVNESMGTFFSD